MRKLLAILMVAVLALSTCVAFAEEAADENVVTIAMQTSPNLDPQWNAGATGAWLLGVMYEGLYDVTATGFELGGAERVDISDDATVWTFYLRQDAKWSDGQPVTANDYVYSLRRLVNPEISTTYMLDYGQYLKNGAAIANGEMAVEELGVTAIDDYTLEIQLENPCTYFDSILTYSAFFPMREDMVVEDGTGNWAWDAEKSVTNGPMKMISCDEDQEIVMVKNEYFHSADEIARRPPGRPPDRRHQHDAAAARDRRGRPDQHLSLRGNRAPAGGGPLPRLSRAVDELPAAAVRE